MLATSRSPLHLSPPASGAARAIGAATRAARLPVAVTATATAIALAGGTAAAGPPSSSSPAFSPAEATLLDAARQSSDFRTRRAAEEVAAGRAGFVALSDGALLRHHGILSADPRRLPEAALRSVLVERHRHGR